MGSFSIVELVHWMSILFPSFSQYTKIVTPLVVFGISVIGIFSNILPKPGELYPIPSLDDLAAELKDRSRLIYFITRISRKVSILTNKVIVTRPYKWFYLTTTFLSNLFNRLRGIKAKSGSISITQPKPYKIRLGRKNNRT